MSVISQNRICYVCSNHDGDYSTADGLPVCFICLVHRLGQPDPTLTAPPVWSNETPLPQLQRQPSTEPVPKQKHGDWVEHEILLDLEEAVRELFANEYFKSTSFTDREINLVSQALERLDEHQKRIDSLLDDLTVELP